MLDKVKKLSSSASDNKDPSGENILIHHSRDTAEKQWAETRVLTLAGVARVFNTKRKILQQLGEISVVCTWVEILYWNFNVRTVHVERSHDIKRHILQLHFSQDHVTLVEFKPNFVFPYLRNHQIS